MAAALKTGGLNLLNSTISGNRASSKTEPNAGGILNRGEAWLKSVTITANTAPTAAQSGSDQAGGAYAGGEFYIANTILAGNTSVGALGGGTQDCVGRVVTLGGNLVGDPGVKPSEEPTYPCDMVPWTPWPPDWPPMAQDHKGRITWEFPLRARDIFVVDQQGALLLADNGGGTCTHALCTQPIQINSVWFCLKPSLAINQAWTGSPDQYAPACETYDQRWVTRDSRCDAGAVEYKQGVSRSGLRCP